MTTDQNNRRVQRLAQTEAVLDAIRRAVNVAKLEHKRAGNPIAVWENGHVVWVPPAEIEIREDLLDA